MKEQLSQARYHTWIEKAGHDGKDERDHHRWTDILVPDVWS